VSSHPLIGGGGNREIGWYGEERREMKNNS